MPLIPLLSGGSSSFSTLSTPIDTGAGAKTVVGLAVNRQRVLVGLLKDGSQALYTIVSRDRGLTWSAPALLLSSYGSSASITSQEELFIVVVIPGGVVKHFISIDAGKTWL